MAAHIVKSYGVRFETILRGKQRHWIAVFFDVTGDHGARIKKRVIFKFYAEDDTNADRIVVSDDKKEIQVWEDRSRYKWYLDLLRNEGPTYINLVYRGNFLRMVTLSTGREEPGEGE